MKRVNNRQPAGSMELILQSDPSENGAAALAMVLSYFGKGVTMGELTQTPMTSAADLAAAARARGIYAQGYQMTFAQLAQAPMPLIAHWRFRSFVVVAAVKGEKVVVYSPEEGRLVLRRGDFEAGFTGAALCFAPGEGEEPRPAPRHVPSGIRREGAALPALLTGAQVLIALCYVTLAFLFRGVAAQLASPQTEGSVPLCLALGTVLVLQGAAAVFQVWLVDRWRRFCRDRNVQALRERLDSEDIAFFRETAYLRLREAAGGCSALPSALARKTVCGAQLVSGVVCLAVMAVQRPAAALAAALAAAAFGAVCCCRRERIYSDEKRRVLCRYRTEDLAARDLAAWETNRLRGQDGARFQAWAGEAGGAGRAEETERQRAGWTIAAAAELLLVFGVCLLEMIAGKAGAADLLGCMALAAAAAAALGALPGFLEGEMAARCAAESAGQVFCVEPSGGTARKAPAGRTLTVQNVTLRPSEDGAESVKDISFTVNRGEILVVTGEAAVRRSLAALVAGLERPGMGTLYLDGQNMADLSDREICGQITLLGGGLHFPRGTVRENIAAGFGDITDYAVMEAASDALLHQRILRRAGRYDTPVSALSEGERILLEFARAFARGTPFLVCNGLTGLLDGETEDQLIRNLRRRGVGAVLLTEDRSLLRKGDLAYRIEAGRTALRERSEFVEEEVGSLV